MNSKVEIATLSPTQIELVSQFFEDRIEPCLLNLLVRAQKSPETQEILMYLILIPLQLEISKVESDKLFDNLQTKEGPKHAYLDLLKSFFALYQKGNETHIFMKPLLDKRFCNSSATFERWIELCKVEILEKYRSLIKTSLSTSYPILFVKSLADTQRYEKPPLPNPRDADLVSSTQVKNTVFSKC